MSLFGRARRCAISLALCLSLCGCFPPGDNPSDEKKDPNFLRGKELISQMDWRGAMDAFEKAIESNPGNASAHFELGVLCQERADDPAAAIYHYQQFTNLNPNSDKREMAAQQINVCKMELIKNMSAVGTPGAQREIDRLAAENKNLQLQVVQLQADVEKWKAAAANRPQTLVASPTQTPATHSSSTMSGSDNSATRITHVSSGTSGTPISNHISSSTSKRTHVVKSHETMAAIAREYGISLTSLQNANPEVRPLHLLVGQTLKIPSP